MAFLASCLAYGQTPDKPLTFDAASVKPAAPLAPGGGGRFTAPAGGGRTMAPTGGSGTQEPGRIRYPYMTLKDLLIRAYDVQDFQIGGPGWLDMERFDIDAVMPPDTTKEQFRAMLRNLLAARFQITTHRETKEVSSYALMTARNGPKFKESVEDLGPQDASQGPPPLQLGKDGFFVPPRRPGLFLQLIGLAGARETFRQSTMQDLANSLQSQLSRPVTDATGLAGKYDFTLTFATEGLYMGRGRMPVNPADIENPPTIFAALQAQLGLRLEPRKGPVELLVIDHAEKIPTEN
jgi:uncharacterized protein (TIGR03435 family)